MDINKKELIRAEFQYLAEKRHDGYIASLESLYDWLEDIKFYKKYITNDVFRDNYNTKKLRIGFSESKDETDLKKDFIMRKKDGINIPWFSIDGFKKICTFLDSPKSIYVRDYFIEVETDYLRVLDQTEKKNKEESIKNIKRIENNLSKFKLKLIKYQKENDNLLKKNIELEVESATSKKLSYILDQKEEFEWFGNREHNHYMMLQKKYMKEIAVYIVNPDFINKKVTKKNKKVVQKKVFAGIFPDSDDTNNSEDDNKPTSSKPIKNVKLVDTACNNDAIYDKKFNKYTFEDIIQSNPPNLYYFIAGISSKAEKPKDNYHKICSIYVEDTTHLNIIKEELDSEIKDTFGKYKFKTDKKGIYQTNYPELKTLCYKYIQNKLCDELKNDRDNLTKSLESEFKEIVLDSDDDIM